MAGSFGVVGCGYVGAAAAQHFGQIGFEVTGTTTSPSRLQQLCSIVDHPRIYRAGAPHSDTSFLDSLDGLLVAIAPTSVSMEEDQYHSVYGAGVSALVEAIKSRQSSRPLHVSYLSSAGVYGNQGGEVCDESTPVDRSNSANALLADAESAVLSLNDFGTSSCVLRLGGIYGPNKDIASFIRSASGQMVPKNGSHINAWVHLHDIVHGINFAFDQRLQGLYNLVDDLQVSRRDLSNMLCDEHGLAPVIWDNHDRPDARIFNARVSNGKLKGLGFNPSVCSMLDPVAAV
ncbi:SDR family oxidoreductase [Synechococcus sp. AH-551-A10]|nr:SDR family oxidoreductase [Synechococcus sp. AH-551-A10]MDB4682326.1 SDR family oxidoreductase [Synechococcus sp. AH-551-A10]